MDCSIPRAYKAFERAEWAENSYINISRYLADARFDHFTFSKHLFLKIIVYEIVLLRTTKLGRKPDNRL